MGKKSGTGGAVARAGIGFGTAFALVVSWTANQSILWAIIHGLLGWLYILWYCIKYHQF